MSPEQSRGLRTIDHQSDLWTLGVVTFECIAGRRPFRSKSLAGIIEMILVNPIPSPSEVAPDAGISPAIDGLDGEGARALARRSLCLRLKKLAESFLIAAGLAGRMGREVLMSLPPPRQPPPEE